MKLELVYAFATALCLVVNLLALPMILKGLTLPFLNPGSSGGRERRQLVARALRAQRGAKLAWWFVSFDLVALLALLRYLGLEALQAGPFGQAGPVLVCATFILPAAFSLASQNDAREALDVTRWPVAGPLDRALN